MAEEETKFKDAISEMKIKHLSESPMVEQFAVTEAITAPKKKFKIQNTTKKDLNNEFNKFFGVEKF